MRVKSKRKGADAANGQAIVPTGGYGQPPVATRFKPGKSGNPKGRPKGSRNILSALTEVYTDDVVVREGDKKRRISRLEALSRKQMELGLKGDQRAAEAAFRTAREIGLLDQPPSDPQPDYDLTVLTDEELDLLDKLYRKMSGLGENDPV
jgi:hypothetical protein